MSLKHGTVNPLAVANIRRMAFCPPHFECISFDRNVDEKVITDWIYENTDGRFFVGATVQDKPAPEINHGSMLRSTQSLRRLCVKVGFEDHSECSYFAMFLPSINALPEF